MLPEFIVSIAILASARNCWKDLKEKDYLGACVFFVLILLLLFVLFAVWANDPNPYEEPHYGFGQ